MPGTSFHSETICGAQRPGEQRGREVRPAAAERRDAAVGGPADETGDDRHPPGGQMGRSARLASRVVWAICGLAPP